MSQTPVSSLACWPNAVSPRFSGPSFKRGQRQPVQVRLHGKLVTYQLQVSWLEPKMAGLVIGAPLHSAVCAGVGHGRQWVDKYDKAVIMRSVKLLEVGIMLVAAVGFWYQWVPCAAGLRGSLMGLHSTLFARVKYAYLPQHLSERELTGGNGMVEMGTQAILLGNVGGGLLMSIAGTGTHWVAIICLVVALVGWALESHSGFAVG